jgi:YopJ Serine/Threonine acetyltransferase
MQRNTLDTDIPMLRKQFQRSFVPDLESYFKEDMILAVARIKKSRIHKSSDFNCVILENEDALCPFLENININRGALGLNKRFQILFYFLETHWIAIDCQFQNNQFHFIVIDPAIYFTALEETFSAITSNISDANITYLSLNKKTKIQRCYKDCGTFSLDILFGLSKIDNAHELISSVSSAPEVRFALMFKEETENKQLKAITITDLPIELGCVVRNMHSISTLEALTKDKNYQSSSHVLLATYFRAHTTVNYTGKVNNGVDYKRRNIKTKTLDYYNMLSNQDIISLMSFNDNFIYHLTHEEPIKLDNHETVSTDKSTDFSEDAYHELGLTPGYVGQSIVSLFSTFYGLLFSSDMDKNACDNNVSPRPKIY